MTEENRELELREKQMVEQIGLVRGIDPRSPATPKIQGVAAGAPTWGHAASA